MLLITLLTPGALHAASSIRSSSASNSAVPERITVSFEDVATEMVAASILACRSSAALTCFFTSTIEACGFTVMRLTMHTTPPTCSMLRSMFRRWSCRSTSPVSVTTPALTSALTFWPWIETFHLKNVGDSFRQSFVSRSHLAFQADFDLVHHCFHIRNVLHCFLGAPLLPIVRHMPGERNRGVVNHHADVLFLDFSIPFQGIDDILLDLSIGFHGQLLPCMGSLSGLAARRVNRGQSELAAADTRQAATIAARPSATDGSLMPQLG